MEPTPPPPKDLPKDNLSEPNLRNLTSTHNQKEGELNWTYRTEPPNLT